MRVLVPLDSFISVCVETCIEDELFFFVSAFLHSHSEGRYREMACAQNTALKIAVLSLTTI